MRRVDERIKPHESAIQSEADDLLVAWARSDSTLTLRFYNVALEPYLDRVIPEVEAEMLREAIAELSAGGAA